MGIVTAHTAPNFAFGNYFKINKFELLCAPGESPELVIYVGFYASSEARHLCLDPMYVHVIRLPVGQELSDGTLVEDLRETLLYPLLMKTMFVNTNAVPHLEPSPDTAVETEPEPQLEAPVEEPPSPPPPPLVWNPSTEESGADQ